MAKEWKLKKVEDIKNLLSNYGVVSLIDVANVPSSVFQKLRRELENSVIFIFAKKNLLRIALEKSGNEKLKEMSSSISEYPALVLTNNSPFKLSKIFQSNKIKTGVKPGQKSPSDITIPEGATPFAPGPMMIMLNKNGVKTKLEAGKVIVKEPSKILEKGQNVNAEVADLLSQMDIKPIDVMIKLVKVYENGNLYDGKDIFVDTEKEISSMALAKSQAIALAFNAELIIKETVGHFLAKSHSQASALAYEISFITDENKGAVLGKAKSQMMALAKELNEKNPEALSPELRETIVEQMLV
ncbi:MAG: 50S ribosomal protein L10 [Candidatus Nanoarchaeia archaeon]|nr:50S ribosomal protein L10 [Candidatus Nanoarchaeia archaeon]